jgi:hypothetical protein
MRHLYASVVPTLRSAISFCRFSGSTVKMLINVVTPSSTQIIGCMRKLPGRSLTETTGKASAKPPTKPPARANRIGSAAAE